MNNKYFSLFQSISGGVLIGALLFVFFKELYTIDGPIFLLGTSEPVEYIFITIMVFIIFQSLSNNLKEDTKNTFLWLEYIFRVLRYFSIGMLFAYIASDLGELLTLGIPLLIVKLVGTYKRVTLKETGSRKHEYIVDAVMLLGYFLGFFLEIPVILFNLLIAIITGHLIFTIIHMVFASGKINIWITFVGQISYLGIILLLEHILT